VRLFKPPSIVRSIYSKRTWKIEGNKPTVYITFDDGPHPDITPFVLDLLNEYNFKATFFCVGSNVKRYPEIYNRILDEGHSVGNHTMNHERAGNVSPEHYLASIKEASTLISSDLFRPPYGKLSPHLARKLASQYKVIMWTWLSYDFDLRISVEKILAKAEKQIKNGDILVLHDNSKIAERQKELLPKLFHLLKQKGFETEIIS
jgi:peptidoglycan/xylan/chitin deacetylase (PgdA/CDA1 family)